MTASWRDIFDDAFLRRLERLRLAGKRAWRLTADGSHVSRSPGGSAEWIGHRDYAAGDDTRFIDWPYYARMKKLLLRVLSRSGRATALLLLDCSASMGAAEGKFRHALRVTAALAYAAMAQQENVILQPLGEGALPPLRAGTNRQTLPAALEFLAGLSCGGRLDLPACARQLRDQNRLPAHGAIILISDLLAMEPPDGRNVLSRCLSALGTEARRAVLHVFTPREAQPLLRGAMTLEDAETGLELPAVIDEPALAAYKQGWRRWIDGCRRACRAAGADYWPAPADAPLDGLILDVLRRLNYVGR